MGKVGVSSVRVNPNRNSFSRVGRIEMLCEIKKLLSCSWSKSLGRRGFTTLAVTFFQLNRAYICWLLLIIRSILPSNPFVEEGIGSNASYLNLHPHFTLCT